MVKGIFNQEVTAGSRVSFIYRIPFHERKVKGLIIIGKETELTLGTLKNSKLILTARGSVLRTPPDKRVIKVDRLFKEGEELKISLRNNSSSDQILNVSLVTESLN